MFEAHIDVDVLEDLDGGEDDPHGEDLEGEEAGEEEEDHRAQHQHDLPPAPGDGGRLRPLPARPRPPLSCRRSFKYISSVMFCDGILTDPCVL